MRTGSSLCRTRYFFFFLVGIISYMMYLVVSLARKVVKMYFTDNYINAFEVVVYCGCILMGFGN